MPYLERFDIFHVLATSLTAVIKEGGLDASSQELPCIAGLWVCCYNQHIPY